jgi:hypothetical protein
MTAERDLERRLAELYAPEATLRSPDRLLTAALGIIETTPQRRAPLRVPWRFPAMNPAAKAILIAGALASAVGLGLLLSGVAPDSVPVPTVAVTPRPVPALTGSFDSAMHGISVAFPEGWTVAHAKDTWVSSVPMFESGKGDRMFDDSTEDLRFVGVASRSLNGETFDDWAAALETNLETRDGCSAVSEPAVIDGQPGRIVEVCPPGGPWFAMVAAGDRGYLITLYGVPDRNVLDQLLVTVQLRPEDAWVRPSLTGTFTSPINGLSLRPPAAWTVRPSTEVWTTGLLLQESPFADLFTDPADENRFLAVASQPLGATPPTQWITEVLAAGACEQSEPETVDGTPGRIAEGCFDGLAAVTTSGGRGYLIYLYGSNDRIWFQQVLATLQLQPQDAGAPGPSASPLASPSG